MISQGDFVTSHAEKLSRVQARHSRDSRSPPPSAQGKLAPCPWRIVATMRTCRAGNS